MAKDCIICGRRAGSGEHVFPAALGGRRVNNGIYCGKHNQNFSPLAAILSDQLSAINARLAVRPDHSKEPRRHTTVNPGDNRKYHVSGTHVEQAAPVILKDTVAGAVRQMHVQFATERQFQEWLAQRNAAGTKLETVGRVEGQRYFTQPYTLQFQFGGLEGLRAIGYVALTFLAHYFPPIARQAELAAFKDFVLGGNGEPPAWWDFGVLPGDIPQNAFRFGHRILIGISATRQEAYARVSLFSTLDFAVHFGSLRVDTDQTIIVDIDPQADRAPGDIRETRAQSTLAGVSRPASLTASLRETIESGNAQERLEQNINRWQQECIAKELLQKIEGTKFLGTSERFHQIRQLLSEQGQSVLNLMLIAAAQFRQQFGTNADMASLVPVVDALVAEDPDSVSGISQMAECTLALATMALAGQVCRDDADRRLDAERLRLLLFDGPGAEIVARATLRPVMAQLGIDTAEP